MSPAVHPGPWSVIERETRPSTKADQGPRTKDGRRTDQGRTKDRPRTDQGRTKNQVPRTKDYGLLDTILAPQTERLLRGAVREAEQHGVLPGLVRHRQPRRDDEDVARTPRERQTADLAAPVPFDRAVDRRVGGSVGISGESRRLPLNERRNC